MGLKNLVQQWQQNAAEKRTPYEYGVRLPLHDAAKIKALAEMYPGRTEEELITDILSAALDDIEASFPYVQGKQVIAEDDQGDPIYEDAGLTPEFKERTRRHLKQLREQLEAAP